MMKTTFQLGLPFPRLHLLQLVSYTITTRMPERPRSLFVTVGSTLFTDLTARVLSPAFYDAVVPLGVSTLVVQLGKAPPPDTTALQADGRYTAVEKRGDAEGSFAFSPVGTPDTILNVRWFRYTNDFEGDVRRADAVISHAGRSAGAVHLIVVNGTDPARQALDPS